MDWQQIAESIKTHQTTLHEQCRESKFVSHDSDILLFQALTKECMTAWQTDPTEIYRLPAVENTLQMECCRGHQHKHLHQAVQSFVSYAKDKYVAHVREKKYVGDLDVIRDVFSNAYRQSDVDAAIARKVYVANDRCHFFYVHDFIGHHVRLFIDVTRGVANTFSGTMQVIAHQFPIHASNESAQDILDRITSLTLCDRPQEH